MGLAVVAAVAIVRIALWCVGMRERRKSEGLKSVPMPESCTRGV